MNILIVDDDKFLTRSIEGSLENHGHVVKVINKSSEFFDEISVIDDYDLVLLDLMMRKPPELKISPGEETGEALYRLIKTHDRNKPVIIITGKDKEDIRTKFEKLDVNFVLKPFDSRFVDLYEAIKNVR